MISVHPVYMILILLALVAAMSFKSVHRARSNRNRNKREAFEGGPPRFGEEMKAMQARLAVLERIAVDKENSLEFEIERLRGR